VTADLWPVTVDSPPRRGTINRALLGFVAPALALSLPKGLEARFLRPAGFTGRAVVSQRGIHRAECLALDCCQASTELLGWSLPPLQRQRRGIN